MFKYKAIVLILGVLLVLSSCKSKKLITSEVNSSDSVRVEYKERIIEKVRVDTVTIALPIEVKEVVATDSSFLETSIAFSWAIIQNDGSLYHTLKNKPINFKQEVLLRDSVIVRDSVIYKTSSLKNIEKIPIRMELRWWEKLFFWSGVVAWVLALMYVVYRVWLK